ncbi:MAG: primosomal protein N' [Candidatus Pacebacteria bacterium]|nr:primosomal protein N' [Candidatus Paceibacterota bacterium]
MNDKKLVAKIIPATKLPRDVTQVFSYVTPSKFEKKIKTGSLVEVFFRNKKIVGVVYDLKKEVLKKTGYKLNPIENLLDDSVSLSKEQIKLAEYISEYYYTPLSLVIKTIVPTITKNKARKKIELRACPCSRQACLSATGNKILLIHNLQADRHYLYSDILRQAQDDNGKSQALILFPEYFDVYNFAGFYKDKFGEDKVAILTSELTKNQYFNEWQKIKNGSAEIIIGTRQAIFASFKNLKLIITDDEHSSSYKQWDMNPRYHGIKIAEKLAKIWKAKIILSSPAPSVGSYYGVKDKCHCEGVATTEAIPQLNSSRVVTGLLRHSTTLSLRSIPRNDNFKIIDINAERQKKNYSVLSEDLQDSLLENIYRRKQAIIFIPRLGNNTITQCRDCHWIAQCKNCETTLVSYGNYLYCQKCQEKIELIKKCPKCQGQNVSSFGYGSEKIEGEIKKLFENKNIKIVRLDSDIIKNKSKQLKIYKDFINKKIDILIGTQMVLKNWNLENLALTAVLFPEIIFNQPEFNSREKSFQFLMSVANKANENHQVIIQTHKPDNELFKSVMVSLSNHKFYTDEIENRKAILKNGIGYPPFSQLIKLIYKDFNSQNCQNEAERMFRVLDSKIKNDQKLKNKFEIIKPFPASNYKEFNKYRWHIIIKSVCEDIELRNSLLNLVKKNWIIDVDPDSVL